MRMNCTYRFQGQDLTLSQIKSQYFPQRSIQWIKKGLLANAETVIDMVNASEIRHREGIRLSREAARKSQYSYLRLSTHREAQQAMALQRARALGL